MAVRIDMNCDMGESFGMYKMGLDEEIIRHVSSANIACGFHAGDPTWMRTTVRLAEENGVAVGAHPSYPDLVGFGRRNMNATADEVKCDVAYQLGALQAFTAGKRLQHVKPHGAMYNQAVDDEDLARAICEAALEFDPDIILVALAGSKWVEIALEMGMKVAPEIFADRALNPDGTLVSRSKPGAVLHDVGEVVERSVQMVTEGVATAITGSASKWRRPRSVSTATRPGRWRWPRRCARGWSRAGSRSFRWPSWCSVAAAKSPALKCMYSFVAVRPAESTAPISIFPLGGRG